jgi:hypothetical protein
MAAMTEMAAAVMMEKAAADSILEGTLVHK